jgi:hypothetical protein
MYVPSERQIKKNLTEKNFLVPSLILHRFDKHMYINEAFEDTTQRPLLSNNSASLRSCSALQPIPLLSEATKAMTMTGIEK